MNDINPDETSEKTGGLIPEMFFDIIGRITPGSILLGLYAIPYIHWSVTNIDIPNCVVQVQNLSNLPEPKSHIPIGVVLDRMSSSCLPVWFPFGCSIDYHARTYWKIFNAF
jgi:hypothetical protein